MFKIAQAAVNQLAACRGCVRGEIILLDEHHREAPARRVARDPDAVDAASDDQQIDLRLAQFRKALPRRQNNRFEARVLFGLARAPGI